MLSQYLRAMDKFRKDHTKMEFDDDDTLRFYPLTFCARCGEVSKQ
jgi:hypothetical protein